ncbi:hypothetical protein QFC22_002027 [Naganishia vaughanmartiniae]|uniref:Uncharacterized protein n=1 Tax=Naganishia vaughanmartiniae TaxID=1424756 RepID=A0ACC2XG60_9TREE|nr:hypothetical protein QFC22_002027 [Naganishia vaughanmartiniae]
MNINLLENGEDKYFANIKSVRRKSAYQEANGGNTRRAESLHALATSLWLSPEEVAQVDPVDDYEYTVQLIGQEQMDDAEYFKASEDSADHWGDVTVVVPASRLQ